MIDPYVLITPARDEGDYVERTINSVIHQTVLPQKWVIVSEGSTDRTEEIVTSYAEEYAFIQLVSSKSTSRRNFGSKVRAIWKGSEQLKGIKYQFIGNVDADVSFKPDYYEKILAKFRDNPRLGIAGGVVFDNRRGKWIRQFANPSWSVAGAIQMFRRQCYEGIGGYIQLPVGGIDTVAEAMARKYGWEVKSFADLAVLHHGTKKENVLLTRFRGGIREYAIGYHPLFHFAKSIYRIQERPYVVGSLFRLAGFLYALLRRERSAVPHDLVSYLRQEQYKRLYSLLIKNRAD